MSNFKGKPDEVDKVEKYLSSVDKEESAPEKPRQTPTPAPPEQRIQKNFKIRKSVADKLMREAMEETIRTGYRVTQEAIVEAVLEERYKDT